MDILAKVSELKIVPVIKIDDAKDAVPLAKALCDGGLPVAEVTFRTAAAEQSIKDISSNFPEMLVGAGSLTSVEQAETAVAAGAKFLVSAGFHRGVADYAVKNNIPYFPGVCTPSEIMWLVEYGLPVAKFFPAGQMGGLPTMKAIAAAFPTMKFMPTGGVNAANINEYLAWDKIVACGGSWMVKDTLINSGNFEEITRLTAEAVALVK
ncbi:bifunctional 4-hydroxy-2-oxoglutarate aldolase/2-dehydro-3-deoxy-phosphogluconate aldolase [Anaerolentibacter hominis]|uniref:bifunctional 4-hydroxy-2-oxoglutarate aldolase/2-dehydro-3-deoxy-phosphogluconate aldolase n=1 Tax=Anaerolentibacter hominis TaxID=3079009 RepID=UPI0031B8113B